MMDVIKRNMPIVLIGGATLLILIGIIVLGNKPTETELEEVDVGSLVADHTNIRGDLGAQFTLVEFSDFQCPACSAFAPVVKQILQTFPEDVRLAYRHFPLPTHANARLAAIAAEAAGQQKSFWEYHDMLFENQQALEEEDLIRYAEDLGLNVERFKQDLDNDDLAQAVQRDVETGNTIGVNATPTFFLNGKKLAITTPNSLLQIVSFEIENAKPPEPQVNQEKSETSQQELIEKSSLPLTISYTSEGFTPKAPEVLLGQKIIWRNESNKAIEFNQTQDIYPDFPNPVKLSQGQTFEFEMTKEGIFAYRESVELHSAMMIVVPKEEPIEGDATFQN